MSRLEIKPYGILRLIPQEITSIEVGRGALLVHTRKGNSEIEVDLASATIASEDGWFGLKKMVLKTTEGPFTLHSVTSDDIGTIESAIAVAEQRKTMLTTLLTEAPTVSGALADWNALCVRDAYLTATDLSNWANANKTSAPGAEDADLIGKLPDAHAQALRRLLAILADPRKVADQRNNIYVQKQLQEHKTFFDKVESKPLTNEQRIAVVHDEDNALVIAGAGTGKTSCIVAKVGFILKKEWAKPEEVLLLAFTQKAAEEMRERIKHRLGVELHVRTFHALGLEIIAKATGKKPSLCPEAEDQVVKAQTLKELISKRLADDQFRRDYLAFQTRLRRSFKPIWEFKSQSEYVQYLLDVEPRALSGRRLKSYEECEIANWLLVNGIRFEYERSYEVDTATVEHRQYKPDFYLLDYDVYIEHWGVDRSGYTASFVNQDEYAAKMRWARAVHQQHGTKLVETYSWERQEDILLTNLESKLRDLGVTFNTISTEAALDILNEAGRTEPFATLLGNFISHFKSAGISIKDVQQKIGQSGDTLRDSLFLRLFEKLFGDYQKLIHGRSEIDFDDMIGMARSHVEGSSYLSPFCYILVDEWQDISLGRAKLIHSLKRQVSVAKLFAVGDDWQSIYRFSGSNITLTTEFDRYFGFTRKTTIDRTFRFHNKIAEFSGRFVQKNPSQFRKQLTTNTTTATPGITVCMVDGSNDSLTSILTEINNQKKIYSVLLLGRYRHTLPNTTTITAMGRVFPYLSLNAMTAHASKGLEADFVIVTDVNKGKYGFPSEIADDPVLTMVLPESERFPFAEERRLFYVALTRARQHVYLLADAANASTFVREVIGDDGYEKVVTGSSLATSTACPLCKRGKIIKKIGDFGGFYGCSNYPVCPYKPAACPRCKWGWMQDQDENESHCMACAFRTRRCPRCRSGLLVERRARSGGRPSFWGCSNFGRVTGSCDYKEGIKT